MQKSSHVPQSPAFFPWVPYQTIHNRNYNNHCHNTNGNTRHWNQAINEMKWFFLFARVYLKPINNGKFIKWCYSLKVLSSDNYYLISFELYFIIRFMSKDSTISYPFLIVIGFAFFLFFMQKIGCYSSWLSRNTIHRCSILQGLPWGQVRFLEKTYHSTMTQEATMNLSLVILMAKNTLTGNYGSTF